MGEFHFGSAYDVAAPFATCAQRLIRLALDEGEGIEGRSGEPNCKTHLAIVLDIRVPVRAISGGVRAGFALGSAVNSSERV